MTNHVVVARRSGVTLIAVALAGAFLLMFANTAGAAIVPTVGLGTAGNYAVLGGQTVTNTGPTTMHRNLGVSPGSSITGFPPGLVIAPGVTDNAGAAQAQLDLTAAYNDTHGRSLNANTTSDLTGLTLSGGVYAGPSKSPLLLSGALTLDGQNNASSVFIFQTDSTLTAATGSVVNLINGAQECNVFWQVGSSATLNGGSNFAGNILALQSVTIRAGVTVRGRALARNGSVTLINDTFVPPTCATTFTPPAVGAPAPVTTVAPGATLPGGGLPGSSTTVPGAATTTTLGLTVGIVGPPVTGVAPLPAHRFPWPAVLFVGGAGSAAMGFIVRRRMHAHALNAGEALSRRRRT